MSVISLANNSTTLVLNGDIIDDLAEGDNIIIALVNPATSHTNGVKTGSVNINARSDKGVADVTIRVLKFGASDVILANALNQSAPTIFQGSAKETYFKDGTEAVESWILENGSITGQPTKTVNSTDGNAIMEYVLRFRNASRNI